MLKAEPKTLGQRCVDWFALKGMLISGTSGNKIVSASNQLDRAIRESTLFSQDSVNIIDDNEQEDLGELDADDDESNEEEDEGVEEEGEEEEEEIPEDVLNPLLKKLMDQCCTIWFGGHGSSSQDMAQGTKNEEPVNYPEVFLGGLCH